LLKEREAAAALDREQRIAVARSVLVELDQSSNLEAAGVSEIDDELGQPRATIAAAVEADSVSTKDQGSHQSMHENGASFKKSASGPMSPLAAECTLTDALSLGSTHATASPEASPRSIESSLISHDGNQESVSEGKNESKADYASDGSEPSPRRPGLAFFVGDDEETVESKRARKLERLRALDAGRHGRRSWARTSLKRDGSSRLEIQTERLERDEERGAPARQPMGSAHGPQTLPMSARSGAPAPRDPLWGPRALNAAKMASSNDENEQRNEQRRAKRLGGPQTLGGVAKVGSSSSGPEEPDRPKRRSSFSGGPPISSRRNTPASKEVTPPEIEPAIQITSKSNFKVIVNAITHVCLAGAHQLQRRQSVISGLEERVASGKPEFAVGQYVILFRNEVSLKFRGVYLVESGTGQLIKLQGSKSLPGTVDPSMIDTFFKYNTGSKSFQPLGSRSVTKTTDAVALNPKYFPANRSRSVL